MKKSILTMCLFIFGGLFLTGCGADSSSAKEEFKKNNYVVEASKVDGINMNIDRSDIEIKTSSGDQILVDYYESEKQTYDITLDGTTLNINTKLNKDSSDYVRIEDSPESKIVTLTLPDSVINLLNVELSNGDLSLTPMNVNTLPYNRD